MKKVYLLLILSVLLLPLKAGNTSEISYAKYTSTCIYSFLRYIEWPTESKSTDFNIVIIGNEPIFEETKKLIDGRQVGLTTYHVSYLRKAEDLTGTAHVVFIDKYQTFKIKKVLENPSTRSSLIITEAENATLKGSMINFVPHNGKIQFELSKGNISNKGIKVSSSLYNLALVVN